MTKPEPDSIEAIRRDYVDVSLRWRARQITSADALAIRQALEARLAILTSKPKE